MWCVFDSAWIRDALPYVLSCDAKSLIDATWFVLGEFISFMNTPRILRGGVIWVVLTESTFVTGVAVAIVWSSPWKIGRAYTFICPPSMFAISVSNRIWGVVGVNMSVEKFSSMILLIDWLSLGNVFGDVLTLLLTSLFASVFTSVFTSFSTEKSVPSPYLSFTGVKFTAVCFCGFFPYNRRLMIFMRALSFGRFNTVEQGSRQIYFNE